MTEDGVKLGQMLDLATPWCLMVAATLRIPHHIAAGHQDIADLAAAADCDRDALHAVLGHLVSKGVFTEDAPGRFNTNQASERLAEIPFLDLDGIGGRFAHTWGTLLDYVRTGRTAYQETFGRPFWEDLAAHPEIAAEFDALMGPAGHGVPDFDIELADGWDAIRTIADIGGGTGAMLAALLRRHPQVRGILVDLPGTVIRASEILADPGLVGRVTLQGQSFFDPLPAGADLYLLKSVLNDWPDEETVAILRRCADAAAAAAPAASGAEAAAAAPATTPAAVATAPAAAAVRTATQPPGRVVILGGVDPDDAPRGLGMDMLVAGGKTSTITEFTELARRAGLEIRAAATQPSGRFVVECHPAPAPASAADPAPASASAVDPAPAPASASAADSAPAPAGGSATATATAPAAEQEGPRMTEEDAETARARSLVHGQVCYLQIPAADSTRAATFYEAVFGWQTERPYQDFESPGLIGQWAEDRPAAREAGPVIWIHVADIDQVLGQVVAHGGQIVDPPSPDGPTRTLATILDPEGNLIGLAGHAPNLSSRRNNSG